MIAADIRALDGIVEIGGLRCRFRRAGKRQSRRLPVFFISGAFQTMDSWKHFTRHFEEKTHTLVADLPGTGEADVLPRERDLDFLADSACAVMDAAGIDAAYVIGASYGSPIAYRLAQRHPDRVGRLALAGVMRAIPPESRAVVEQSVTDLERGDMGAFARHAVEGLLCLDPERPVDKRRLASRVLSGQLQRMSPGDQRRFVENTRRLLDQPPLDVSDPPRVRTLLFTGEHDVFTTPQRCRELARALPDAVFTYIERTDHLFHLERFDVTLALFDTFYETGRVDDVAGCRPGEWTSPAAPAPSPLKRDSVP
jgi:pimeloyl-ACP methyl ester carboxylesterase